VEVIGPKGTARLAVATMVAECTSRSGRASMFAAVARGSTNHDEPFGSGPFPRDGAPHRPPWRVGARCAHPRLRSGSGGWRDRQRTRTFGGRVRAERPWQRGHAARA